MHSTVDSPALKLSSPPSQNKTVCDRVRALGPLLLASTAPCHLRSCADFEFMEAHAPSWQGEPNHKDARDWNKLCALFVEVRYPFPRLHLPSMFCKTALSQENRAELLGGKDIYRAEHTRDASAAVFHRFRAATGNVHAAQAIAACSWCPWGAGAVQGVPRPKPLSAASFWESDHKRGVSPVF